PRRRARTVELPRPVPTPPTDAVHSPSADDPRPLPRPLRIADEEIRSVGVSGLRTEQIVQTVADPPDAWTADAGTSDHFPPGDERTRRAGDPPSHLAPRAAATHGGRGLRGHSRGDARSRLAPRPPRSGAALRLDALGPALHPPRGRADPQGVRDRPAALRRPGARREEWCRTEECPGSSPRAGAIPFPRVPDVWSPLPPQSAGPPVTRWIQYRTPLGKTAVARLVFPWTSGAAAVDQRA